MLLNQNVIKLENISNLIVTQSIYLDVQWILL